MVYLGKPSLGTTRFPASHLLSKPILAFKFSLSDIPLRRLAMKIEILAMAGTLESSDALVTIEPCDNGIDFELDSVVIHQYGHQIRKIVMETLARLDVSNAKIRVVDKGALDCTLKARVECAVFRANKQMDNIPWGGMVR